MSSLEMAFAPGLSSLSAWNLVNDWQHIFHGNFATDYCLDSPETGFGKNILSDKVREAMDQEWTKHRFSRSFPMTTGFPKMDWRCWWEMYQEGYTLSTTHPDHFSGPNSIAFNDVWSTIQWPQTARLGLALRLIYRGIIDEKEIQRAHSTESETRVLPLQLRWVSHWRQWHPIFLTKNQKLSKPLDIINIY